MSLPSARSETFGASYFPMMRAIFTVQVYSCPAVRPVSVFLRISPAWFFIRSGNKLDGAGAGVNQIKIVPGRSGLPVIPVIALKVG